MEIQALRETKWLLYCHLFPGVNDAGKNLWGIQAGKYNNMTEKKLRNIFVEGPISPVFISERIAEHRHKTGIGGHSIFLGQVRADVTEGKKIIAIEYSAYNEMGLQKMHDIREAIFAKYPLSCMHVYHSLGRVPAGEICLFVFTSSPHRKPAIDACSEIVERIKSELPIWGKELFEDAGYQWKVNN
jgi:molybdopterin synthase catalytic subunit